MNDFNAVDGEGQGNSAQEIVNAILAGQKIQAIKLYREQTNSDLMTAKVKVEAMERELRETVPEQFRPSAGGCASTASMLLLTIATCVVVVAAVVHL